MKSAIVSLLLPRNQQVLEEYVRATHCTVLTMRGHYAGSEGDLPARIAACGGESVFLEDVVGPEYNQALRCDAIERSRRSMLGFDARAAAVLFSKHGFTAQDLSDVLGATLADDYYRSMRIIESLTIASDRFSIKLAAVNEDVRLESKTAALWAKSAGIPAIHLSHSAVLGTLVAVHQERNTDDIVFFGEKASESYFNAGVVMTGLHYIGNPAWDRYTQLLKNRTGERERMQRRYKIPMGHAIVLFATTWASNYTALSDPEVYEESLRAVFRAYAALPQRDFVHLVVKDRSSNDTIKAGAMKLAAEAGLGSTCWTFTMDDLPSLLVSASAVLAVNSNVTIEAAICGVPAINVWSPMSWLTGPCFDALDGVLEPGPDDLAAALECILTDANLRSHLLEMSRNTLGRANAITDGNCGKRVSEVMLKIRAGVSEPSLEEARLERCMAHVEGSYRCALEVTGSAPSGIVREDIRRVRAVNLYGALTIAELHAAGFTAGEIDLVIFAHSLEEIYDPWATLVAVRSFLAADARLVLAIDNLRSFGVVNSLIKGDFGYDGTKLGDRRVLRRFTAREIVRALNETGFHVTNAVTVRDPAYVEMQVPQAFGTITLDLSHATLKAIPHAELQEWTAAEIVLTARPAEVYAYVA